MFDSSTLMLAYLMSRISYFPLGGLFQGCRTCQSCCVRKLRCTSKCPNMPRESLSLWIPSLLTCCLEYVPDAASYICCSSVSCIYDHCVSFCKWFTSFVSGLASSFRCHSVVKGFSVFSCTVVLGSARYCTRLSTVWPTSACVAASHNRSHVPWSVLVFLCIICL